jgi:hypothetical protein
MSPVEIVKRLVESFGIYYSRLKYRDPSKWPYRRFAPKGISLKLNMLPGCPLTNDWGQYQVYNYHFDLAKRLDWYFSDQDNIKWPVSHYSKINYRPDNPYGDVRINWELSRLQFLPAMAISDEKLAKSIIKDWMTKNPYVHGPAYLSSMEVALRWLSIYWAACLLKQPLEKHFEMDLTGLAVASGKFIESHFSTHSSAGNHLIVEAVGLLYLAGADAGSETQRQPNDRARDHDEGANRSDADQLGHEAPFRIGDGDRERAPYAGDQMDRYRANHVVDLKFVQQWHRQHHDHAADAADQDRQ